jgi:hypothetical protein
MTEKLTTKLRSLMARLDDLRREHNRERNCPSRGYDEDSAINQISLLSSTIDAELDAIDATAMPRRTPAPEGEVVNAADIAQMTCFANNHGTLEDWAAWCRIRAALSSPVVPVGREEIAAILESHIGAAAWSGDAEVHGIPEAADAILAALGAKDQGSRSKASVHTENGQAAVVEYMVQRFLAWRLPESFSPDNGISFDKSRQHPAHWPCGTNLLDYRQATEMVLHMIGEKP